MRLALPFIAVIAAGCGDSGGDGPAGDGVSEETACLVAEERLGRRVCVHRIEDREAWEGISFSAAAVDQARTTTYLAPAVDDARLPTVFVDGNGFDMPRESLHHKFLTEAVEDLALLEYGQYLELTLDPERREWFAGNVTEYIATDRDPLFGFTVWDMGTDPAATITCAQFERVHDELAARIEVGDVALVPANDLQRATVEDCGLPVHDPSLTLDYEAYTRAQGCGTLRRFTLSELADAERNAGFGWQDVLVIQEAPLDIETITSGVVTGSRQGELSHLNVRSASRGTPNCYVKDGYELLADLDGKLVQLDCGPSEATIVEISAEQVQACQEGLMPDPVQVVPADFGSGDLVPLLDVPTETPDDRRAAVGRFGSKGANLATLYQRIDPELQLTGFLLPLHHYRNFVRDHSWTVDAGDGPQELSFEDTVDRWLEDAEFLTDGAVRRERLGALRAAMRDTACDAALVAELGDRIALTHGSDEVMVRFRSSSNAEDALGFNGAGLYDSTSVCFADETDGDSDGPSHCDAEQPKERDACRGLTKVWASLWNMKAFEERQWYGIDHRTVAMGILVNTRTKGELSNIVAFTGNPLLRGDDRYLINAQQGELAVVAAEPGVWPEKDLLTVVDGEVLEIERDRGSTELPQGQWVLDDGQLEQLGAALAVMVELYPVDEEFPATGTLLLDTEWKVRDDGRLAIKQIRPFLQ